MNGPAFGGRGLSFDFSDLLYRRIPLTDAIKGELELLADDWISQKALLYGHPFERCVPGAFKDTPKRRRRFAKKALGDGEGWACRLQSLGGLRHLTLHVKDLGLASELAAWPNILTREGVGEWKRATRRVITSPHYGKLELGENRVHAHVIAVDGPNLPKLTPKKSKSVDDLPGLLRYLGKPPYPTDQLWLVGAYLLAQNEAHSGGRRLYRTSWRHQIPNRKTFHRAAESPHLSRLRVSFPIPPVPHPRTGPPPHPHRHPSLSL